MDTLISKLRSIENQYAIKKQPEMKKPLASDLLKLKLAEMGAGHSISQLLQKNKAAEGTLDDEDDDYDLDDDYVSEEEDVQRKGRIWMMIRL
uniref:WH2 domain-containing protein n=1 Tax=Rhabditophanes sp. KR3021 TaxID=114890 RepID=A0AC35TII9_9BILA